MHGFKMTYTGGGYDHPHVYSLSALPEKKGNKLQHAFCIDHKGIILGSTLGGDHPRGTAEGCVGGAPVV